MVVAGRELDGFGVEGVVQGYGRRLVLDGVTLWLPRGRTALLGSNGAGKSTLMRTLVTDLPPRSGALVHAGRPIVTRGDRRAARERIGYLPQDFGFDSRFRVQEYVEYMAWLRGVPASQRRTATAVALERVGLTDSAHVKMGRLSGGMRQRSGIAGAIVGEPDVLVLDEPTVGLDPAQRAGFRTVLRGLPTQRVLLSTHLTEDVESIAEHVIVLEGGQVMFNGSLEEFRAGHESVEQAYLALAHRAEQVAA